MNYLPLIYAFGETNVAVTGTGTLDGQADNEHWWPWKGNARFGYRKGDPEQQPSRVPTTTAAIPSLPGRADRSMPVFHRRRERSDENVSLECFSGGLGLAARPAAVPPESAYF